MSLDNPPNRKGETMPKSLIDAYANSENCQKECHRRNRREGSPGRWIPAKHIDGYWRPLCIETQVTAQELCEWLTRHNDESLYDIPSDLYDVALDLMTDLAAHVGLHCGGKDAVSRLMEDLPGRARETLEASEGLTAAHTARKVKRWKTADGYQVRKGGTVYIRCGGEYPEPGRWRIRSMRVASIHPNRKRSLRLEPDGRTKAKMGNWRAPEEVFVSANVARGFHRNAGGVGG